MNQDTLNQTSSQKEPYRQNSMTVTVKFSGDMFYASAQISCPDNDETEISFVINSELTITSITGDDISYQMEGTQELPFRPLCRMIKITGSRPVKHFTLTYCGSVRFDLEKRANWYNIVTDDFVSLSFYSAWFPQELSVEIPEDKVIIEDGSRWFVVKGDYDPDTLTWEYGGKGFDPYNIVAYDRTTMKVISTPYMNIYFADDNIAPQIEKAAAIYNDIIKFYNGDLFAKTDLSPLDVACASPYITIGGGYRRKDFMWCTSLGEDTTQMTWLFAHETAHIWCSGADTYNWEDWLNETTAEWSSILFGIKTGNEKLVDFVLQPKLERCNTLPPIKTPDQTRPEGVHDKGTVLFYQIYDKIGFENMKKVIRCFADSKQKDTYGYLADLRKAGLANVADMIESNLEKQSFV